MNSGRIYGPYPRSQVIDFIRIGKITGEEQILVGEESEWRSISSDPEFFDQLINKDKTRITKLSRFTVGGEGKKSNSGEEAQEGEATQVVQTPVSQIEVRAPSFRDPGPLPPQAPLNVENTSFAGMPPKTPHEKSKVAAKKPLQFVKIFAFAVGASMLVTVVYQSIQPKRDGDIPAERTKLQLPNTLNYLRPLVAATNDFEATAQGLGGTIEGSDVWEPGLGASVEDQVRQLKNTQGKFSAAALGARAWSYLWLEKIYGVFYPQEAKVLNFVGQKIYSELKRQNKVSATNEKLFEAMELYHQGEWRKLEDLVTPLIPNSNTARWLAQEAQWWSYWASGANGNLNIFQTSEGFSDEWANLIFNLRKSYVAGDSNLSVYAHAMAARAPTNLDVWFGVAEMRARAKVGENLQLPFSFFMVGGSVAALYPGSVQKIFWLEFAEFLSKYGRRSMTDLAAYNFDWLQGTVKDRFSQEAQRKWWDLGDDGLDVYLVSQDFIRQAVKSHLGVLDQAALMNLSGVLENPTSALEILAENSLFRGQLVSSENFISKCLAREKNNSRCLGAQIWLRSLQFRFDEALDALEKLKTTGASSEVPRWEAWIHFLARDPDKARDLFYTYTRSNAGDPWGQYFLAFIEYKTEHFKACVDVSKNAFVKAQGELLFRTEILLLQCKILAKEGVRSALDAFKQKIDKDPLNVALNMEYIDALVNADFLESAIPFANDALKRIPYSFDLRLKTAELYQKKHDPDLALVYLNKALEEQPDNAEVSLRIGKLLEAAGRLPEAIVNYESAARKDPSYPETWLMVARANKQLGRAQEVTAAFQKEIQARPTVAAFVEATQYFLSISRPQEAVALFQKNEELFRDDPQAQTVMGQAYLALGDDLNARFMSESALRVDPSNPEASRVLGFVLEREGDADGAVQNFENYLRAYPGAPDAAAIRARLQNLKR